MVESTSKKNALYTMVTRDRSRQSQPKNHLAYRDNFVQNGKTFFDICKYIKLWKTYKHY